jgi:hypothetical protein
MRDKIINNGYYTPVIMAIIVVLFLIGNAIKAQTKEEVYKELIKQDVKHPEIVLAQSIKETGWFKCENCSLDHNNLFGIRYKNKYLEFATWQESITRYKVFQDKRYDGTKNYLEFLDCIWMHSDGSCARYATSENYTEELKEIIKQL